MLMKYKKVCLLCFLIILIFIFSLQINAGTINSGIIKLAIASPAIDITTPYYVYATLFKDIVERETQGRFKVDIYPYM